MLAAIGYILYLELYRPCYTHHYGEIYACSHTISTHYVYRVDWLPHVCAGLTGYIKVFVTILQCFPELSGSVSGNRRNFMCEFNNSHTWINAQVGTYSNKLEILGGT